jgi:hypothetical protein
MTVHPRVLLVGPSGVAQSLESSLTSAGYQATVVADFARARILLDARPDLLITELKLGTYNGLHLAIRALDAQTPTIVIGDADPVLEAEAERQRAKYVTAPIDAGQIVQLAGELLQGARHTRRSIRKRVPPVDAIVNNQIQGHLCDVSYEGMRIEAAERDSPPQYFNLRLPQFDFSCRVKRVWTSPAEDQARVWCGAMLTPSDSNSASEWRELVDRMPGFAVQ